MNGMMNKGRELAVVCVALALIACGDATPHARPIPTAPNATAQVVTLGTLDEQLSAVLEREGFTGRVGESLEQRLGRPIDRLRAEVGRMLWFDPIQGLNDDNTCGGCHSPTNGFGDTQSMAIGIENNRVVGPGRSGPRNQRRSPMAINTVFYPTLMWNSRFRAQSGSPFDNRAGFLFPVPEGEKLSYLPHLLTAQAFIPPTERVEAAGFHTPGDNFALRAEVVRRLNADSNYRQLFTRAFPGVQRTGRITYDDIARAISEFEFTLVFANAPIDRFARGDWRAMSNVEKQGALVFFGKGRCVTCHAVAGASNEMFSDFREHVAGIPQVVPHRGNVTFDGPGSNEDFGLAQVTGTPNDRYAFRTSPLRNVALQSAFMHNGAFTQLEDAVRYHLNARRGAMSYTPLSLPPDMRGAMGPILPVLDRLDGRLRSAPPLSDDEVTSLIAFVRNSLLDPRAMPTHLRRLIPDRLPSGRRPLVFQ